MADAISSSDVSGKLSQAEKDRLAEWKDSYNFATEKDKASLPRSFLNLWLGNSATKLVRHPDFPGALARARERKISHDAEQKQQAAAAEAKRAAEEAERAAHRYLYFWHYRGVVYGAQKYRRRAGDSTYPVTEFFLQRQNSADEQIELTMYDVPIANGQEVAVVYGAPKGQTTGHAVAYCNLNLRKQIFLSDNVKDLTKKSRRSGGWGVSTETELSEYIAKSGLA